MEVYSKLPKEFQLEAFAPKDNLFPLDEVPIKVNVLPYENEVKNLLKQKQLNLKYRLEHNTKGFEFALAGLTEALSEFDLIQTWETFTFWTAAALEAKEKYGIPVIITVWDNIPFDQEELEYPRQIKEKALKLADQFLVYTRGSRRVLISEGVNPEKISIVLPSVDTEKFKPEKPDPKFAEELGIKKEDIVIIFSGRLVWEKGIYDLIHALAEALRYENQKSIKLLIVGDGPEKENLIARSKRAGVEKSVIFTGKRSYEELKKLYNLADIIAAPSLPTRSWQEQFCMALIEGMASGLAGIASYSGGLPEILGDAGILVPPGDYSKLAEAINTLVGNRKEYKEYCSKARERAEFLFNQTNNAEKIAELYSNVLNLQP